MICGVAENSPCTLHAVYVNSNKQYDSTDFLVSCYIPSTSPSDSRLAPELGQKGYVI